MDESQPLEDLSLSGAVRRNSHRIDTVRTELNAIEEHLEEHMDRMEEEFLSIRSDVRLIKFAAYLVAALAALETELIPWESVQTLFTAVL